MKDSFDAIFDGLKRDFLQEAQKKGEELAEELARETLKSAIKLGDRLVNAPRKKRAR